MQCSAFYWRVVIRGKYAWPGGGSRPLPLLIGVLSNRVSPPVVGFVYGMPRRIDAGPQSQDQFSGAERKYTPLNLLFSGIELLVDLAILGKCAGLWKLVTV